MPVLALGGCVTAPVPLSRAARPTLQAELAHLYDYPPLTLEARTLEVLAEDGWSVRKLELTPASKTRTGYPVPGTDSDFRPIRVDWYRPDRPGLLPAVLVSPILAGNDLYIRGFSQFYAGRGMHAFIIYRPKEVFSADRGIEDIEKHFRESVVQLRQALDWVQTLEGVDPEQIGSFAISMGAIVTTLLAAVEPRVKASVLGLPAGHVARVIMASQDKAIRKRRGNYLKERGWDDKRGLEELEKAILSEPMRFAPSIDPARVLMITGVFDRVLGLGRSMALWRALGRPRLVLLPTGHYTSALASPYLKAETYSFLRRRLDRKASPGPASGISS